MKQCKKILSAILCVILLVSMATVFSAVASAAEYDTSYGVVFTDSTTRFSYAPLAAASEECIIIAYNGKNKDVVIPGTMPYKHGLTGDNDLFLFGIVDLCAGQHLHLRFTKGC